jgi:hypothetical protein
MMLLLIAAVVLMGFLNLAFYEFRVQKKPRNDIDITKEWINKKLTKKYKC